MEVLLHGGSYQTDYMHRWIAGHLEACGIRTWRDLKYTDPGADRSLPEQERYSWSSSSADIFRGRMRCLPWDYQHL